MKKLLSILAIAAALVLSAACTGNTKKANSPEDVATTALKALQKEDYKAFVDTYDMSDSDKKMLVSMIEDKLKEQFKENGGIKSFDVQPAEIQADTAAVVKAIVHYNNGTDEEQVFNMVKVDGKWYQHMNK